MTPTTPSARADRTLRDVVALSILPAIWLGAEPVRIAESLAAAVFTVVDADFVCVCIEGDADHHRIAVAQVGRNETDAVLATVVAPTLLDWARTHDPDDVMSLANPCGGGMLRVTARPLALDAEYGVIAAGFLDERAPSPVHQLLLNVAATQATTAIDNVRLLRSLRRHTAYLSGLAEATDAMLQPCDTLPDVLQVIAERARLLVGAHLAVTTLTTGADPTRAFTAMSRSEAYARDGAGDPWDDGGRSLTAPLVAPNGADLGSIRIRDKIDGAFTVQDERILRQLARTAALIIEQRRADAAQRAAIHEIEAARAEAEAANRAKDEFLAMLGHELRNPLAPIHTALQLMRLRGDATAERERLVIERQVRHLTRLVDDLLDVSRIARGKVDLRSERLNFAEVVAKAIELASPLIEERRHIVEVDVPRTGLEVDGDPLRLAQAVANVLTNAAKYTAPGGRVTIRAASTGDEVVLTVCDTGVGISPDMLPHIFDLFVQGRQSIDRAEGGLGLGLTIVRSLVSMHGGTVSAFSDGIGRGSTFTIRVPAAPAPVAGQAAGPAPSEATPPVTPEGGLDVLVVDDNEDAAEMLGAALRAMGHAPRIAHDGLAALRMCAEVRPHVALLDLGLPVMDGYELAHQLHRLAGPRIHLVAVTGYGQANDRERSQASGFSRHLVKPIDLHVLEAVLREHADALPTVRASDAPSGPAGDRPAVRTNT